MTNLRHNWRALEIAILTCLVTPLAMPTIAAAVRIDEAKQAFAASGPVLGGYVVLCESIAPQQPGCGAASFSDIVVFNGGGGAAVTYYSDADTSAIPFIGDHDPADVGFAAPGFIAAVLAAANTQYFDETLTGGVVAYTPIAGQPGFPLAGGVAATGCAMR